MWIACTPGFKPESFTSIVTRPLCSLKVAVPETVLPLFGSRFTFTTFFDSSALLHLQPIATARRIAEESKIFFMFGFMLVLSKLINETSNNSEIKVKTNA
jgi:hypothetical protein